jgi:hypothetical protein
MQAAESGRQVAGVRDERLYFQHRGVKMLKEETCFVISAFQAFCPFFMHNNHVTTLQDMFIITDYSFNSISLLVNVNDKSIKSDGIEPKRRTHFPPEIIFCKRGLYLL